MAFLRAAASPGCATLRAPPNEQNESTSEPKIRRQLPHRSWLLYLLIIAVVVSVTDHSSDTLGKIFAGGISVLGLSLWLAAFLLYRCNRAGQWIWWVCSPFVLVQFPIGTALGVVAF